MEWQFHPEAEAEFIESAAYYEDEVSGLGHRFGRAVWEALELLLTNPGVGSPLADELRSFALGSFPYSIIYVSHENLLLSWQLRIEAASPSTGNPVVSAKPGLFSAPRVHIPAHREHPFWPNVNTDSG